MSNLQLQNMEAINKGVGKILNTGKNVGQLLEVGDLKNIGKCKFATDQAIFDVSGIINGDK